MSEKQVVDKLFMEATKDKPLVGWVKTVRHPIFGELVYCDGEVAVLVGQSLLYVWVEMHGAGNTHIKIGIMTSSEPVIVRMRTSTVNCFKFAPPTDAIMKDICGSERLTKTQLCELLMDV